MESEARYAWVGAMMIVLLLALAAGIYWLSGASDNLPSQRYTVYFRRQSLEGLQIGGEVRMRGIKVGRVIDYTILPDPARGVRVLLEVDARTPLLEGAKAEVNRKLVTGIAGVDLVNTKAIGAHLDQRLPGERYPLIAEGVTEIDRMTGQLEGMGSSGAVTLQRINQLLSEHNQRAFRDTLENTRVFTGELARAAPALRQALEQTRRTAQRLESVGVAAASDLHKAALDIDGLTAQSRQTLSAARSTFEQSQQEITALSLALRLSADLASQDIQATGKILRDSGSSLQQTAHVLADPQSILFGIPQGNLGPGEKNQ